MKPAKIYTLEIGAGQPYPLNVAGDFFKILSSTGSVRVQSEMVDLDGIGAGQGMERTPFQRLTITDKSGALNTVRIIVAGENFLDASVGGSVNVGETVLPTLAAPTHAAPVVAVASTNITAANPARKYLLIQNQHPTRSIWVHLGGAVAVAGPPCAEIIPGGNWEPPAVPLGVVTAITVGGDNDKVVVVEG